MSIKKRIVLPMALAMSAVVMLAVASLGNANYMRPVAAGSIKVSLVPNYNACPGTGGQTHGTPLAFPSCAPVASGTGAAITGGDPPNDGAASSQGTVSLKVLPGAGANVLIKSKITDVRCAVGATTACGNANPLSGGRPDYVGGLQGTAQIRITDNYNGVTETDDGTVVDIPFSVTYTTFGCVATPGAGVGQEDIGSKCTADTSANTAVPGAVKDGKRAVVQTQTINILDGGPDGVVSPGTTSIFETQGIFIP